MSKISKKIVIVMALCLVFVTMFAGCSAYKQDPVVGGDASKPVTNNGGLAVKQGDYLYYINGLEKLDSIKERDDNTFGNVVKGAIMRSKLDAKGNIVVDDKGKIKDTNVLVPLVTLSAQKNGGINVYGNWVYYTTPSTVKDSQGVMQTTDMAFMRTNINGTKTQEIITLQAAEVADYKFTTTGLVYYNQSAASISKVNYDDNEVKNKEVVAEDVTSALLPKNTDYTPGTTPIDDVIFYTQNIKDNDEAHYNATYAVVGGKANQIVDYSKLTDKKAQYAITLKNVNVLADSIEVYYNKSNVHNVETNDKVLYGAVYKDGKLDVANEVKMTDKDYPTIFFNGIANGVTVLEGDKLIRDMKVSKVDGVDVFNKKNVTKDIPSGAVIIKFMDYKFQGKEEAVPSMLYLASSKLYIRALDDALNLNTKVLSDETYTVDSSWLMPEVIGENVYFFNNAFYGYMESVNINTGAFFKDADKKLTHPMAKLNAKDKATEDKRIEDEKKAEEENK